MRVALFLCYCYTLGMKNAIILHGGPSKEEYYDPEAPSMSNAHWIPWLQGQLLKHDIATATPEVPRSFERIWSVWQREVERFEIGPETILVGHSTGAGFFLKYLSTHQALRIRKLVLVAPWLDPDHELSTDFFRDVMIDPSLPSRVRSGVHVFHSDNDQESVMKTVAIVREALPDVTYREFPGYRHFCIGDMNTEKFPELVDVCVRT